MSLRRLPQFRLPTLLVAVAVVCLLLTANTRPSQPVMLGHVSMKEGGLWIMGSEYGWPWTWRVQSEDHVPDLARYVFDEFHLTGLSANVAVGLLIVFGSIVASELTLWGRRRWRGKNGLGG
jgi:hypothetical protein